MRYLGADQDEEGNPRYWWTSMEGDDGSGFPLTVAEIQANGLTDKLRDGIAAGRAWTPPKDPSEPKGSEKGLLDGWSWEAFESDGETVVALSNRPSVDAATERGDHVPELRQATVPYSVLRAAVGV